MKINTIRIPCRDLTKSTEYYERCVGLTRTFGGTDDGFVGFQLENVQILLEPEELGEFECGRYLGFSLEVPDIFQFHDDCQKRGVTFTTPPEAQDWGGVMTHIKDCNGNTFSIVQCRD